MEISYIPGCITWHYIVLKPSDAVDPEYFKWLFKSPRYIQALQRTANFIRDGQDLRFSNFVQVPLPLIPMDEQREIAEYLNRETARIDGIIADVTEQIEKLKEYVKENRGYCLIVAIFLSFVYAALRLKYWPGMWQYEDLGTALVILASYLVMVFEKDKTE